MNETLDALSSSAEESTEGIERIIPTVPQAVVALAQLGQLVRIRRSLERQEFEGLLAEITLPCTGQQQSLADIQVKNPYLLRCATALFVNDGPNTAYILINGRLSGHINLPITLRLNESHPIDFSRAEHRIEELSYWCDPGNTASVRVEVKY